MENWRDRGQGGSREPQGGVMRDQVDMFDRTVRQDRMRRQIDIDDNVGGHAREIILDTFRGLEENWRGFDPLTSCKMYVQLEDSRHEIWIDYLSKMKSQPTYRFGDIRVNSFVERMKRMGKVQEGLMVDEKVGKLTPDILIYDYRNETVFLGDLAVTVMVGKTKLEKREKYMPVKKELERIGLNVQWMDFILHVDLSNLTFVEKKLYNASILNSNNNVLLQYTSLHETCNLTMARLKSDNTNPGEFDKIYSKMKKKKKSAFVSVNVEIEDDMTPEVPQISEDTIIGWIKDETERKMGGFFDKGYDDARIGFTKLYEEFSKKNHMKAKSSLHATFNTSDHEKEVGHDLILSYIDDIVMTNTTESCFVTDILPTRHQIMVMKNMKGRKPTKEEEKGSFVYGSWQYKMRSGGSYNPMTSKMKTKLMKGKKNKNEGDNPMSVSPEDYGNSFIKIEKMITYLGSQSNKAPFLNDEWDGRTDDEMRFTITERERYDYCRKSNGAQLGQALSLLHIRLMHLTTKQSQTDNVFVPPNGSFIVVIPKEHKPINDSDSNVPLIFITRISKFSDTNPDFEYETRFEGTNHNYFISKLCRLELDKISHWDQAGHRIVATTSFLSNTSDVLWESKERLIGTITMLTLDLHQKTSELFELLKYVSFMPFSDGSRVSHLILSKFNIMLKTNLDVWAIKTIEDFMERLSEEGAVEGRKPKLKMYNGYVMEDSLGMTITIPSFINRETKHKNITDFIEEISALNIVRGKQFYGNQFMEGAFTNVAIWNNEYENEIEKYGDWTEGRGSGVFPFESEFCFSSDIIIHAIRHRDKYIPVNQNHVAKILDKIEYQGFIHHSCGLKGSLKEKEEIEKPGDSIHTTSLDAALAYYKRINYDDTKALTTEIAKEFFHDDYVPNYFISPKPQRGSGRPIATGTLRCKAGNLMIEKPEQAIGTVTENNILVAGKHSLKTQSETFKRLLGQGVSAGKKQIYHGTCDATKFSEKDNTRKMKVYVKNNTVLPEDIRQTQLKCLRKMENRIHTIKKMPDKIRSSELSKYMTKDGKSIRAIIGWPQGMLNNMSTSLHSLADYWITAAFNKAYKTNVKVEGLVHSDDSWFAIACDSAEEMRKYTLFRINALRMFCIKTNDKKTWLSRYIGELVSNFNINGVVMNPIIKPCANAFGNLLYQNWVIDVNNQVSSIQQMYRQGATIGTLIMMGTILRQQILAAYNIKKDMWDSIYNMPIEMGGYPMSSAFELGTTGILAHYRDLEEHVRKNPKTDISKIVLKCANLSRIYNKTKSKLDVRFSISKLNQNVFGVEDEGLSLDNVDYQSISIPQRGEIFSCIQHIIPKSKKISRTVKSIEELPFESDGLEMLVTRPDELKKALGHLKSQMGTTLFRLASEKYSSNKKRLAMNQSIQATGKTVRICGCPPMTIRDMRTFILNSDAKVSEVGALKCAFDDGSNVVNITREIVYYSEKSMLVTDKRKKINRCPDYEDKFSTVCNIKTVLLKTIDKLKGTNHIKTFTDCTEPEEILSRDSENVMMRFKEYFSYYEPEYACSLIMQQYLDRSKMRLWVQPKLRNDDLTNFFEDLYGKTLSREFDLRITVSYKGGPSQKSDSIVETIYSTSVLNRLYPGKFEINKIDGVSVRDSLLQVRNDLLTNDSMLKFSILNMIYNNDMTYITKYDNEKVYCQYYTKPQKKQGGKYVGDFEVVLAYGNLCMKVKGEPGNVEVTVNRPHMINEMLICMYRFVQRDFPDLSYPYPGGWNQSKFWYTELPRGEYLLIHYGPNQDILKLNSPSLNGLSMTIDNNLKRDPYTKPNILPTFEVDETLRVVYKNFGENSRVRIGNVYQNMKCPLASKVTLFPEFIDGYYNGDLLSTGVMQNITFRTGFKTNQKQVRKLLSQRNTPIGGESIGHFIFTIGKKYTKQDFKLPDGEIHIEEEVREVSPIDLRAVYVYDDETTPEDLTAIDVEVLFEDTVRVDALLKHTNLTKLFCKHVTTIIEKHSKNKLISYFYSDRNFMRRLKESLVDADDFQIEIMMDAFNSIKIEEDLLYFVLGNDLDLDFNVKEVAEVLKKRSENYENHMLLEWCERLKNVFYKYLGDNVLEEEMAEILLE